MAATMGIYEINGGAYTPGTGGTNKAAGNIAFRANDSSATDSANPVVRPAASTQQSFEKWLHMRASGVFTTISSPRFYTASNSIATGVNFYCRTTNTNTFAAPAVPANNDAGTLVSTYNSGSTKALNTANAGPFSSAGDIGDFLVTWASVGTTAAAGSMGSSTFVFVWDEVG